MAYVDPLLFFLMPKDVMKNSCELVMANEEIDRNVLLENLKQADIPDSMRSCSDKSKKQCHLLRTPDVTRSG